MAITYFVQSEGLYVAYGLSGDTKPASPPDNCLFIEIDTALIFASIASAWVVKTTGANLSLSDITTNDVNTSRHGFFPKLPTPTGNFLKDDLTWAAPPATVNIKQTEIDFGTTPVSEASFIITDADVSAGSQLIGNVAYEAPTEKDLDELDMDRLDLKFAPGSGQFTLYVSGLDGYLHDKFKINYLIG